MTTPYIDPNLIFAENAPTQDKPAAFANYNKGWDESRNNYGRPLIPQMNYLTQQADLKNLYIHENGAALPYKDGIAYEENAVVVKDGVLQQWKGGVWKSAIESELDDKADKTYVDEQDNLKADKTYVDTVRDESVRFYQTLAEANADIANLAVNQAVQVGESGNNGGLYYKATAGATTLTKSAYDPFQQFMSYMQPKKLVSGDDLNTLNAGYAYVERESDAAGILNLPTDLTTPRRFYIFTFAEGTSAHQKIIKETEVSGELEIYERVGNGQTVAGVLFQWLAWKKTAPFDVYSRVKTYADSNAAFAPQALVQDQDLNSLSYGIFYTPSVTVGASILNKPVLPSNFFIVMSYPLSEGIRYQKIIHYNESQSDILSYERVRYSSSGENWTWRKVVSQSDLTSYQKSNLFKQTSFQNQDSSSYQGTVSIENDTPVLSLNINPSALTTVYYEYPISEYMRTGDVITFSASVKTDAIGTNVSADVSIIFLAEDKTTTVGSSVVAFPTKTNEWERLSVSATVPSDAKYLRMRFIRRVGVTTYAKFKEPMLQSSSWYAQNAAKSSTSSDTSLVYVAKSGNDGNDGSSVKPFKTVQAAVNKLMNGGTVVIQDNGWYRETVIITSPHKIKIKSARGKRGKIVGSTQLVVTKTSGYSKVYQASLAAKPTGVGGDKGQPMIAEWGTKFRQIEANDVHALQRGYTHYLPYTPMYEAASITELDTVDGNGKWFWQAGIIYFSAVDGGDATLKQYEARVRETIKHSVGELDCERIDFLFSNYQGFLSTGTKVTRTDCSVYGSHLNGFADYANSTVAYRDISLGNGNDGLNGTVTVEDYTDTENLETACQGTYFDPWSALNHDDGCSYHIRGTCTIYGGLMEYNRKAGVVHVTGGGGVCYNTIARGNDYGFYTAAAAPDGRNKSSMHCHSTIAERNNYNYYAGSGVSELYCFDTKSYDPVIWGYAGLGGRIYTKDAKYRGDAAKARTGNVHLTTSENLT